MNLQIFENKEFGKVRTIVKNSEPLFIAKDICDILGLSNSRQAVSRLDNDEKNTVTLNDGIGNPNKTVVNEYGLYNLVLASRKPQAKAFKRWITHEVIPAIRKTGKYAIEQQTLIEEPYKPSLKYYRGIPVITKKDLATLLNTFPALIQQYMNRGGTLIREKDYFVISGLELKEFDKTNPCTVRPSTTALTIITESGVRKICRDRKRSTVCKDIFGAARRSVASLPNAVADDEVEVPKKLLEMVKSLRKEVIALDCITKMLLNTEKRPQKEIDGYRAVIVDCYGEMITDIVAIRSFE